MADPYESAIPNRFTFGRVGAVITPGATDLDPVAKTVVLLTSGNVTIMPSGNDNGDTLAFVGLPAGYIFPYQVRRVTAATATVASVDD